MRPAGRKTTAQTAKDYLVNSRVAQQRLSMMSYGEELRVCGNHNEQCSQKQSERFVIKASPTR
jgi:outer membrane protein OmpA-like peptidoglycan-associated protein